MLIVWNKEEFVEFISCKSGTTGEALSDNVLWKHGLDIALLRGRAYDEAGAMAGSVNSVAAKI